MRVRRSMRRDIRERSPTWTAFWTGRALSSGSNARLRSSPERPRSRERRSAAAACAAGIVVFLAFRRTAALRGEVGSLGCLGRGGAFALLQIVRATALPEDKTFALSVGLAVLNSAAVARRLIDFTADVAEVLLIGMAGEG